HCGRQYHQCEDNRAQQRKWKWPTSKSHHVDQHVPESRRRANLPELRPCRSAQRRLLQMPELRRKPRLLVNRVEENCEGRRKFSPAFFIRSNGTKTFLNNGSLLKISPVKEISAKEFE